MQFFWVSFLYSTLSNEEFLTQQNFSNNPTPADHFSPNVNAKLLNSWFCDLDDSEDENLYVLKSIYRNL